jgi:MFS family permease
LQKLLWLTAAGNGLSQLALAGSFWVAPLLAFPIILLGTALLGLSFGLSGAPLNSYPPQFFPRHAPTAVVALHTLIGLGLMVGPLLATGFGKAGLWIGFPLLLLAVSAMLTLTAAAVRLPDVGSQPQDQVSANPPLSSGAFWMFAAIVVLYAFAEGTFGNWAVIYLSEVKQLPAEVAGAGAVGVLGCDGGGSAAGCRAGGADCASGYLAGAASADGGGLFAIARREYADAGIGTFRASRTGLLGLFPADHYPGLGPVPGSGGLGIVHADRGADGRGWDWDRS